MKKLKLLAALCFAGCIANAQIIYTIAGTTNGFSGDGGAATSARLNGPTGIAFDASGNLYVGDTGNNRVRKVTTAGIISTVVGNGTSGFSGDGGQATAAKLTGPWGLSFDGAGNLYIADKFNGRVRKVTTAGVISTFAGGGSILGDGGQATAAALNEPNDIAFDASGNLYIADGLHDRIRKVTTAGIISTVAGGGSTLGDGGQATAAEINTPYDVAFDVSGNLYIADENNFRIRKVTTAGIISTFAGNGTGGYSGDGGQATAAELFDPYSIAFDASGNLYIADELNYRVRMVNTLGVISTVIGGGTGGDGGAATAAGIGTPQGVAVDAAGNLYVSDPSYYRVRKVSSSCPANAGVSVIDYDNSGTVCSAVSIGTTSLSGVSYAWSPTVALSCTNCAQPNTSYDNPGTPQVYTLTVSSSVCTTNTSTVMVTTLTPTITASVTNATAIPGSNITVVGNYTANFTPDFYYWSITQCDQYGTTIPGGYTWDNGWAPPVLASGSTFTFPGTSTLTCGTYYYVWFNIGSGAACSGGPWFTAPAFQIAPPANAGPNTVAVNAGLCCPEHPATIGTPSVTGMTYSWAPSTVLSSTTAAQPTCAWTNTATPQIYTLTVSSTLCATPSTSTVQITAESYHGNSCCRIAEGIVAENQATESFVVYPNPASGQVTLSLYDKADYIQVIDMQGRLVFETKNIAAQNFKLDISKYTSGIYFIRAKIGETIEKQKLVVE